jgi:putative transcriptional regulator
VVEVLMMVNHVSRVMGERRLSIAETARRAGLAYTVVFGLYHGTVKRVDLDTLDALCHALEVGSLSDLIEYVPEGRA